ncbi:hypothetical protein Aperf_G00000054118 [Anoplocephala perfoliata]
MQQDAASCPDSAEFCEDCLKTISNRHGEMLANFGVILAFGILDAGGCIMTISFQTLTGSTNMLGAVVLLLFQSILFLEITDQFHQPKLLPAAIVALSKNLEMSRMQFRPNANPPTFACPTLRKVPPLFAAGKGTGRSVAGYDGPNNNVSGLREEILSIILVHTSLFGTVLDDDDDDEEEEEGGDEDSLSKEDDEVDDAVENADMDDALLGEICEEFTALANCQVNRERVKDDGVTEATITSSSTTETANTRISAVSEIIVTAQSQNQPIVASVDINSSLHIHRYGYPSSQEWEEDEEPESDMDGYG